MKIDLSRGQQRCAVGFTPSASLRRLHAVTWRSYFDLDVEMRDGTKHCFSMIPSDEGRPHTKAARTAWRATFAPSSPALLSLAPEPRSPLPLAHDRPHLHLPQSW